MTICIPVVADHGVDSPVCEHFGSAPLFMIVDTDSSSCRAIPNHNAHHAHGMCMPLQSLQGERLDGIVVGGIGAGALGKLMAAGLQVFLTGGRTVAETVSAYKAGQLREFAPSMACGGHHGQGGMHGAGPQHRGGRTV
jgi:predicted Fe-Mo cluster-binding NifX family protein